MAGTVARAHFRQVLSKNRWFRDFTDNELDYPAVTEPEWAYLAGLIDGEGSIRSDAGDGGRGSVHLEIANTYLPILEEWGSLLGGVVRECRLNKRGRRRCFELALWRGNRVRAALEHCFPYLRIKKWHAAFAILYLRRNGLWKKRGEYDAQLLQWLKQANGYRSF